MMHKLNLSLRIEQKLGKRTHRIEFVKYTELLRAEPYIFIERFCDKKRKSSKQFSWKNGTHAT